MKREQSLTEKLLNFFLRKPQASLDEFIRTHPDQENSVYPTANRLEKSGLLEKIKLRPGPDRRLRSFFQLTRKGKEKLKQPAKTAAKKTWDGLWRLLVFDIPEDEKGTREYLREQLKRRGFYMLQLSVWLTPYEVDQELRALIEEIGARHYVRFMVVKEIDYEKDIMQFFGL